MYPCWNNREPLIVQNSVGETQGSLASQNEFALAGVFQNRFKV